MKRILGLLGFLLLTGPFLQGQVIAFHEDFELPGLDDSVTSTISVAPNKDWNINTRMHHLAGSLRSDTCQVKANTTQYLTTNAFSTVGNTYVVLTFSQVCKIDFLDIATLEVSNDNGTTWVQLTQSEYLGTGQYGLNGNRFASNSYGGLWIPGTPNAVPMNTWWRSETFDLSDLLPNTPNAKIRFKLADGGTQGPNNNAGWFLDNIKVTIAPSELIPPVITLVNPYPQGLIYSLGPFTIKAKITDQSGIDTAYIVYSKNNGPADTVGMTLLQLDTMTGQIPNVLDGDSVCWHVEAFDNSLAHNWARNPLSTCIQFKALGGITFPFCDNFDFVSNLWTASYGGTNTQSTWELGTPAYGQTNSAHSPPNAWDVNLTTVYGNSANCILTSPVFDFSNAVNAKLSFWLNYDTETIYDGTKLEYTTNGTTWQILGGLNDPLGTNWYTNNISSTSQPAWAGSSSGWKQSKYKLTALNNVTGQVRFRFVFTSDGSITNSGASLDDFCITLPAPQEAMLDKVVLPVTSGCGLGSEPVKITIVNTGMQPITGNLTASYKKAAWAPAVTENVPGNIAVGDSLSFTFTTPVDLSATGQDSTFNLKIWIDLLNDPNHFDDTLVRQVQSRALPAPPTVTNVTIPYGTSTSITATSPYPVKWYDSPTGGTLLVSAATYQTPILYGTTVYYAEATGTNGCIGPRAPDTVFVGQAPPYDGSTLALVTPSSGINLGATMAVETQVKNYGTQPISNFPVSYTINNGTPVTENVTATVQPGATYNYVFTTTADLSQFGTYLFKAWLDVPNDTNQVNDTVTKTVTNSMFSYCDSRATTTYDLGIGNVTLSNMNNGNANPAYNNVGAGAMYTDFSFVIQPAVLSRGQTYNVSVAAIYTGTYHYTAHCKVFIDWNYDGVFDEATETAFTGGPNTQGNTTMTGQITVPVTAALGLTKMRVVLVETSSPGNIHPCNTYSYGETEDYNALIMPQLPLDAGIVSILSPALTYPQNAATQPEFTVKNHGLNNITNLTVGYRLDNNPVVSQVFTGNLASNTSTQILFPAVTFPTGYHSFCAFVTLTGDGNSYNDTLCRTIFGVPTDTLPYYDNFDGPVYFINNSTTGGTNWIHGAPATGSFPGSTVSPPNVWGTNLNMTSYTASTACYLTTQFFDFSNAINATLSFWWNCNTETSYDGTRLEYSLDGGTNWSLLGSIGDPLATNWYTNTIYSSNQPAWAGNSNGWKKSTYLLSAFNQIGAVRFRFVFTSDGSVQYNGMAIDDFKIILPYPKDAGVDKIYAPTGIKNGGDQVAVQVRLNNFGMDTLYTTPVSYTVGNAPPVTQVYSGILNPGDSTTFTFTTLYTVPNGSYTLKVYTSYPDDGDHMNDTTKSTLFGIPTFIVPFFDNFDSAITYFYTNGNLWEWGTPTSPVINTAHSQPDCWKTRLDGIYPHTTAQYLYSPRFDFTILGMDSLNFYHWFHTHSNDFGRVEYFSWDSTWKQLGFINDPNSINWYNVPAGWGGVGSGYEYSKYDLKIVTDYAIPTQFRFSFFPNSVNNTTFNGWAIDDVELTFPRIQIDAGVTSIIQPTGTTTYGTDITVEAVVKNFGWDTLTSIPVKYMINGITVGSGVIPGPLYPDSSVVFTFNPMPSPLSDYKLCVYTDLNFDTYFFNDSTCNWITVIPPPYDLSMVSISSPTVQTLYNDSSTVSVRITNLGLYPVNSIPLFYTIQDTQFVIQETWQGATPLEPGDSVDFTFSTKYLFHAFGYYYICAWTGLTDDGYRDNDTVCNRLESLFLTVPDILPGGFAVWQNTPNPAGEITRIRCTLPTNGTLGFTLLNQLGQTIMQRQEKVSAGEYILDLDTRDLPPGAYHYRVNFGDQQAARKMLVSH